MNNTKLEIFARKLDNAILNVEAIPQLSLEAEFGVGEAYKIQRLGYEMRLLRGEKAIGMKMGFTSRAKMIQMGVHDMIWGRLTDAMVVEEGAVFSIKNSIHARIEPELCFLTKKEITREITLQEAGYYLESIAPAMEILDSRYKNFKFSLTDVIADNTSAHGIVLGKWCSPEADISNLGMILSIDGKPVHIGSSAAILGDPMRSFVAATRLTVQYGQALPAGSLILAGAATAAVALSPGMFVKTEVEGMGSVSLKIGE